MDAIDPSLQPQPEGAPQPKSRFKTCLVVTLLVAVIGIVLCAGVGAVFFTFGVRSIKNMAPYKMSLEQAEKSPQVIQRLGEPIEDDTWLPQFQVNVHNNQGSATVYFQVKGPKGRAHVHSKARLIDGDWGLTELTVTFADGQRVELETGTSGNQEEEAPKWVPPSTGAKAPEEAPPPPEIDLKLPSNVPPPAGAPAEPQPGPAKN